MALRSFRVENQKALRLAECQEVPMVMVIAGPNGVGKSTLLYALKQKQGVITYDDSVQVLYQPPHRAIRRQRVRRSWLGGAFRWMRDIFAEATIQGFDGLNVPFPQRAPDNVDEAGSTIKYTLGKIENRKQSLLSTLLDTYRKEKRQLDAGELPDIYEPMRRLTSRLLPHLAFDRVDFSDEENIRCVFTRTDVVATMELDLDDLSSGEKSIVLLFLPLVEDEMNKLLKRLDLKGSVEAEPPRRVFLVDEPEQHLHPDLQARILGYVRDESARTKTQFIFTTHSPALVDEAFDNELYLLDFPKGSGENQLKRVATSVDRLDTLRMLAGSTYIVTTGRPIVCLEGSREADAKPGDIRLLEILFPRASRYTYVPVGGKGNVISVVRGLRENLPEDHFGIKVLGLVDKDRAGTRVDGVVAWPVATVENLLLHEEAIAEAVGRLVPDKALAAEKARELLLESAQEQRGDEIRVRVAEAIGARTIRIKGLSVDEVKENLERETAQLRLSDERVAEIVKDATTQVDQALSDRSYLRVFRGKELLQGLYGRLGLSERQISYSRFTYDLAGVCASNPEVQTILGDVFSEIDRQVQAGSMPAREEGTRDKAPVPS